MSLFLFSNQEKEEMVMKLVQVSEAAPSQGILSRGVKAASFPSVGKETCFPAAEPRHCPTEGRFVLLYLRYQISEMSPVVEVAAVLHSLILIPAEQTAGCIAGWWKRVF